MSKPSEIQRRSIKISHASAGDKTIQKGVSGLSFGRSGGDIYYEKTSKHDRGKNIDFETRFGTPKVFKKMRGISVFFLFGPSRKSVFQSFCQFLQKSVFFQSGNKSILNVLWNSQNPHRVVQNQAWAFPPGAALYTLGAIKMKTVQHKRPYCLKSLISKTNTEKL